MTDAQALAIVVDAFQDAARPEHFTDYRHCEECEEHDALRRHTRESISIKELGNPGWDPVCFLTNEGFRYYLPALARLALGTGEDYYIRSFVFHLDSYERLNTLTKSQKAALVCFLQHLRDTRWLEVELNLDLEDLDLLIEMFAT